MGHGGHLVHGVEQLLGGHGNLLGGRDDLVGGGDLLVDRCLELLRAGRKLGRGGGDLDARALGLSHHRLQVLHQAVEVHRQVADLVLAVDLDALGEIGSSGGDFVEFSDDAEDGARDGPAHDDAEQDDEDDRDSEYEDHPEPGRRIRSLHAGALGLRLPQVELDVFVQRDVGRFEGRIGGALDHGARLVLFTGAGEAEQLVPLFEVALPLEDYVVCGLVGEEHAVEDIAVAEADCLHHAAAQAITLALAHEMAIAKCQIGAAERSPVVDTLLCHIERRPPDVYTVDVESFLGHARVEERHGDRVRLLTRGTGDAEQAEHAGRVRRQPVRPDVFGQIHERPHIAKKPCLGEATASMSAVNS
jgi:hypothetical protein